VVVVVIVVMVVVISSVVIDVKVIELCDGAHDFFFSQPAASSNAESFLALNTLAYSGF